MLFLTLLMLLFPQARNILLADDDKDDSHLFGEVLAELHFETLFTVVYNGEQLMQLLNKINYQLPDILFLDFNLPLKNGLDCLKEIKTSGNLKQLPVIIFSTSYESSAMKLFYNCGANYYIRKPNNFDQLKIVIDRALTLTAQNAGAQPPLEKFVLAK